MSVGIVQLMTKMQKDAIRIEEKGICMYERLLSPLPILCLDIHVKNNLCVRRDLTLALEGSVHVNIRREEQGKHQ